MKKALLMLSLVVAVLALGASQAYATLPVIDGVISDAFEWDNINTPAGVAYPYHLVVTDPNEADNAFDNTDISRGVVLQELTSFSGDATFGNDGIYILLEVYAPPPTLDWDPSIAVPGSGIGVTGVPTITMQGDLLGDGLFDPFNIFMRHTNTVPDITSGNDVDLVEVCVGSVISCNLPGAVYTDLTLAGGSFARGSVIEYYIPSGTFGTPPSPPGVPFPPSFIGHLNYDNGLGGPNTSDDIVIGQLLVPEPSTVLLTITGLMSMFGFGKLKFWN